MFRFNVRGAKPYDVQVQIVFRRESNGFIVPYVEEFAPNLVLIDSYSLENDTLYEAVIRVLANSSDMMFSSIAIQLERWRTYWKGGDNTFEYTYDAPPLLCYST